MKTILVLGSARSGTSMTSGLLSMLGVRIVHDNKQDEQNFRGSFENSDFNKITSDMQIESRNGVSSDLIYVKHHKDLENIFRKNESDLWGLKSAATHWNLDVVLKVCHNPHLIITSRNILHNAQSWQLHMKHNYGQNVSIEHALETMAESLNALIKQVKKAKCPKLWLAYEDTKKRPWEEAKKVIRFLEIKEEDVHKKRVTQFISKDHSTLSNSRDYIS